MMILGKEEFFFNVNDSIAWSSLYIVSNILHLCLDRGSLNMCFNRKVKRSLILVKYVLDAVKSRMYFCDVNHRKLILRQFFFSIGSKGGHLS